jgi:hypothetical protein
MAKKAEGVPEALCREFQDNDFPRPERSIKRLRRTGALVVLLDGLDEVADAERAGTVEKIQAFLKDERACRVFITSRPSAYGGQFSGLVEECVNMAAFTPVEIRQFIRNWDFPPPKTQDALVEKMMRTPPILEVCRNPLMLTIVASLYKDTSYELPDSREEFYRVCIDALLRRWDAAKNLDNRNEYAAGVKQAFLQELSFKILERGYQNLSEARLLEEADEFASRRSQSPIVASRLVEEVLRSGLLSRLPNGDIFFAHKTLAEALAASCLGGRVHEIARLWTSNPSQWLEVVTLYVANPTTTLSDISTLIAAAESRGDWSGLVIVAGEAHNVPQDELQRIASLVIADQLIWNQLDDRAVEALARFEDAAEPVFVQAIESENIVARGKAMRSLGRVRADWARKLIVATLVSESGGSYSLQALVDIGEDAVPAIVEITRSNSSDVQLLSVCAQALGEIATESALFALAPMLKNADRRVWTAGTLAFARALSVHDYPSIASTATGRAREPIVEDDIEELTMWATGWLAEPHSRAGTLLAWFIRRVADMLGEDALILHSSKDLVDAFASIPDWVLTPALVLLGSNKVEYIAGSIELFGPPFYGRAIGAIRAGRDASESWFPFEVARTVVEKPSDECREMWVQVCRGEARDDNPFLTDKILAQPDQVLP